MKTSFILLFGVVAPLVVSPALTAAEPTVGPYVQAHGGQAGGKTRALNDLELTAITRAEEGFWPQANALANARNDLSRSSLQAGVTGPALAAKVQAVADAELAYALSRADAFAKVKSQLKATEAAKVQAIARAMSEGAGTGSIGGGGGGRGGQPAAPAGGAAPAGRGN